MLGRAMIARQPQMLQMSAVETGQMSSVETGQMSAVETGQMSAVENMLCVCPPPVRALGTETKHIGSLVKRYYCMV